MSASSKQRPRATLSEFLAIPESERFHEIIDGELVVNPTLPQSEEESDLDLIVLFGQAPELRDGGPHERPDRLLDRATILRFTGKSFRQPADIHGAPLDE